MKTLLQVLLVLSIVFSSSTIGFAQEAPTGESPQEFCEQDTPTLADIIVEGIAITWFNTSTDGDMLALETPIEDNTSYWAAQGSASGAERLEVLILLNSEIPAPIGYSPQSFCATEIITIAELIVNNTAGFFELFWYATTIPDGTPLALDTLLTNGTTYYAFQGEGGCAEALAITVEILTPPPAPIGASDQYFCATVESTLEDIVVSNTDGYSNIIWYSEPWQEGAQLNPITPLVNETTYYAFQGIGICAESLAISVHIQNPHPAPIGETIQYFPYITSITLADLEVYNTDDYDNIYFSLEDSCGAVIPLETPIVFGTTYYASQFYCSCDTCCTISLPITISCNLGLTEPAQDLFSIYPNPTKNTLNILSTTVLGTVELKLYSVAGQLIISRNTKDFNHGITLDVSKFSKGLYFLKITVDGKSLIQQISID